MTHGQHETTSTSRPAFQATIYCLIAFVAAFPVNLWFIARGLGHAVVHGSHS